jgi:2-aminoethylphosphonate-pyruvate transaminase
MKKLFTPGPLNTSDTVKQAMLHDLGSRDAAFIRVVQEIRDQLLALGNVSQKQGYEAIPIQGSGTFGIEATIGSAIHRGGKLLVIVNGAYGERMLKIADRLNLETQAIRCAENEIPDTQLIHDTLQDDAAITDVALAACETTSGILNPTEEIGAIVHEFGRTFIVDAMSSFGGIPLDIDAAHIDYLVSSSNKCIEGVPGFSFVIAKRETLLASKGSARSISLDLLAQWESLEGNGQFRFTPPTHTMLAFHQALSELGAEGGVAARHKRYQLNHVTLVAGMRQLGFRDYVPAELQSPIITTFHFPEDPNFQFEEFYESLSEKGHVIYPGKLTEVECFRIGNIGQLHTEDIKALLSAVGETIREQKFTV